jgi:hypothetical protein
MTKFAFVFSSDYHQKAYAIKALAEACHQKWALAVNLESWLLKPCVPTWGFILPIC